MAFTCRVGCIGPGSVRCLTDVKLMKRDRRFALASTMHSPRIIGISPIGHCDAGYGSSALVKSFRFDPPRMVRRTRCMAKLPRFSSAPL